jgi:hypothetical protein
MTGKLCCFYVTKPNALATGVGPYTLPHTPADNVFILHGMAPQAPTQIALQNEKELTLDFTPSQALFFIFSW